MKGYFSMNNDVQEYSVLKPIDIGSIYEDAYLPQEQKAVAYGDSFREGSRKNQDELDRTACWGRAQVFMNNFNKPKTDAIKRYEQLRKIPVEKLISGEEIEVEDADLFKPNKYSSNPITPIPKEPEPLKPEECSEYNPDEPEECLSKEPYSDEDNFFTSACCEDETDIQDEEYEPQSA